MKDHIAYPSYVGAAAQFVGQSLSAPGHKVASTMRAWKTFSLHVVRFRTSNVTTGDTVEVRIETVDATGNPTGTLFGANTNAFVVIPDAVDNSTFSATLISDTSITRSDDYAIVIVNGVVGNLQISTAGADHYLLGGSFPAFPSSRLNTSGSWVTTNRHALFGLEDSAGIVLHVPGMGWAANRGLGSYYSSGENGVRFRLPFGATLDGIISTADPDVDFDIALLADATLPGGARLATASCKALVIGVQGRNPGWGYAIPFDAPVIVEPNTWYRLTFAPTGLGVRWYYLDFDSSDEKVAAGFPEDWYLTETNAGSFSDTPTRVPLAARLLFSDIDGAGGGGGGGGRPRIGNALIGGGVL